MSSIPMVRLNIHELSSEEPYLSRILRIRNECSKKSKKPELTETKTTFKYVDKISLVMCETPKVNKINCLKNFLIIIMLGVIIIKINQKNHLN